jgi:hypothetical protein
MEQAREIPLGRPFSLSLYPQEDRDVFRLKPASSGLFSLNLAAAYEGVGITVDFYDAEKKPIASNVNDIAVEAGSTYYIVIKQSAWHKFGQRPFLLIADIGRHEDTYEPNNSFETAGEIAVPAKLKIAVYPQGDVDYFRLALKEQGYLTELISGYDISTVGKAFYENVLIDVYGEDKEMVGSFNNKASPSGKFQRYLELKPGVYYLRIAAESPAKDFFSVDIGFLPKDKLNEPLPADKKRKDFSFCILGIGMKNDLSAWIDTKLLADNLGGDFILVESKGEIEKAMIKSLQQAKAEIGGNNWYLILLTLLLAGGVFWLFVYLIRRDKKK